MSHLEPAAIRSQLERILGSTGFRDAGRIGPLLSYLVEKTLAGETESIKESVVGVEVFQRPADYDPRTDPIVRVDARRLRTRLDEYYQANPGDPIVISLPKGGYVPAFAPAAAEVAPTPASPSAAAPAEPPARFRMSGPALVFIMITVMSLGISIFMYLGTRARRQEKPAIAVLPFKNLSAEPNDQYFTDGLTIELIEALTRIESLRVVSWNTASRFRGKAESLGELRSELNAAAVLDGSVRRQGDTIRVTAQLVNTAGGNTLWSQTWNRQVSDVFKIQEELAKSIVYALRVQMSADPDQILIPARAANMDAYNDYLRARFHRNNFSKEGMARSSEYAQEAIRKDPAYAPPYALLASNIVILGYYRDIPAAEAAARGKELALKAIQLDPRSAEGHAALGLALSVGEWKFQEARGHLLKAIELNPGSQDAHSAYVLGYLLPLSRLSEAEVVSKHALQLDPLSFWCNLLTAYTVLQTPGREAEAIQYYEKAIEIYPRFDDLVWDRGMAYAFAGKNDMAREAFRQRAQMHGDKDWSPGPVEAALLGEPEKAVSGLKAYQDKLGALEVARAFALVGDKGKALDKLDQAYAQQDRQMMFIKVDRRLAALRGEPRFQALVQKIGLAD